MSSRLQMNVYNENNKISNGYIDWFPSLKETLSIVFDGEKVFVFIDKKVYENLNTKIKKEIDDVSLESISKNSTTIDDILSKNIVIVRYNKIEEIQEIISMRKNMTKLTLYATLEIYEEEFKYI